MCLETGEGLCCVCGGPDTLANNQPPFAGLRHTCNQQKRKRPTERKKREVIPTPSHTSKHILKNPRTPPATQCEQAWLCVLTRVRRQGSVLGCW